MRSDLKSARSFERACLLVHQDEEEHATEPVVLLAFYAALRYVNHYLFPMEVTDKQGKTLEASTLDDYIRTSRERGQKHEIRLRLLEDRDQDAADAYNQLWDSADKARYHLDELPKALADQSVRLMCRVKERCAKEVQEEDEQTSKTIEVSISEQGGG